MAQRTPGILVVDGAPSIREQIDGILGEAGLDRVCVCDGAAALEAAADASIGVVLLDAGLPDVDGDTPLERLLALRPALRVIALAGAADEERVLGALRAGACDYLAKPLHAEELLLSVQRAGESFATGSHLTRLRGRLGRLVARIEELDARVGGRRGEDRLSVAREGIVEAASEVLEADKTSLLLLDADADVLRVAAWTGRTMKPEEIEPVDSGKGVAGGVFDRREPLLVVDSAGDARVTAVDREGRYRTGSFVAAPISRGAASIGVVCATDRTSGGEFSPEDLELLRILAAQAGALIASSLGALADDTVDAESSEAASGAGEADVDDEQAPLDTDAELARAIAQAATDEVEAERVFAGVLKPLSALLPAAPVSIFVLDPADGELRREGECDGGVANDRQQLAVGRGLTGHVLQTGQLVATARPDADPRFDAEVDTPMDGRVRPYLCLPLSLRGKVVGVCRAFLHEGTDPSARSGEVIAPVLSAAVRNALLYRSLVEAIEDVADARRAARS